MKRVRVIRHTCGACRSKILFSGIKPGGYERCPVCRSSCYLSRHIRDLRDPNAALPLVLYRGLQEKIEDSVLALKVFIILIGSLLVGLQKVFFS